MGEIYSIKESPVKGLFGSIVASLDTNDLTGRPIQNFQVSNMTLEGCVDAAISGTGWKYVNASADNMERRNITENNINAMKALEKIAEVFWVEISFSTKEKENIPVQ